VILFAILDFGFRISRTATKQSFWFALASLLLVLSFDADAQQAKIYKIGWLSPRSTASSTRLDEFRQELNKLGDIEGKNLVIESRYAEDKLERLPLLADELVALKVDVLFTRGTPETLALKKATNTIPIVFYTVTDPVGAGLVESLARPGGNITGFSSIESVLAGKRLELLKETVPKLLRVSVLWNPKDLSSVQQWKQSQAAAPELGLQLHSMEVSSADRYETAFKEAVKTRSTALAVIAGSLEDANQKQILELATKNKLPAIYPRLEFVSNGGLMSYGADGTEPIRRAALLVDKILKGAKPADLPVEQASKFALVINLKAAKQISLTIPQSVFARADRVIR
jgi:putative tryptophan/tyrosine transport system substrate-binding protein